MKNQVIIEDLIKSYEEYIEMLVEELSGLAVFASTHGWKTKKYEQGKKMREKIKCLKKEFHKL